MQINRDYDLGNYSIRAYREGEITIGLPKQAMTADDDQGVPFEELNSAQDTRVLRQSFIISGQQLAEDWAPQRPDELSETDLEAVLAMNPEIIILGTGRQLRFPPAKLIALVQGRGVGLEVMDSAAACRTYNFLMSDGRRVAAAIMPILSDA